jgi:legumain
MYEKMVIYIEACESGSMFDGILKDNINVYATTAANDEESSWGTYCPPDDAINGVHINSCLGDLYSVNWMEDTEANDVSIETLEKQFSTVQTETAKSHVMEFGEKDFKTMVIGDFEGDLDQTTTFFHRLMMKAVSDEEKVKVVDDRRHVSAVSSRDAHLNHLYSVAMNTGSHKAHIDLSTEVNHRMKADHVFE